MKGLWMPTRTSRSALTWSICPRLTISAFFSFFRATILPPLISLQSHTYKQADNSFSLCQGCILASLLMSLLSHTCTRGRGMHDLR